MADGDTKIETSLIVSGISVTAVGVVLTVSTTPAFVMTIAFGVAVLVAGLVMMRRSGRRD